MVILPVIPDPLDTGKVVARTFKQDIAPKIAQATADIQAAVNAAGSTGIRSSTRYGYMTALSGEYTFLSGVDISPYMTLRFDSGGAFFDARTMADSLTAFNVVQTSTNPTGIISFDWWVRYQQATLANFDFRGKGSTSGQKGIVMGDAVYDSGEPAGNGDRRSVRGLIGDTFTITNVEVGLTWNNTHCYLTVNRNFVIKDVKHGAQTQAGTVKNAGERHLVEQGIYAGATDYFHSWRSRHDIWHVNCSLDFTSQGFVKFEEDSKGGWFVYQNVHFEGYKTTAYYSTVASATSTPMLILNNCILVPSYDFDTSISPELYSAYKPLFVGFMRTILDNYRIFYNVESYTADGLFMADDNVTIHGDPVVIFEPSSKLQMLQKKRSLNKNFDFATDISGWTVRTAGNITISWSSGKLLFTYPGGANNFVVVEGEKFRCAPGQVLHSGWIADFTTSSGNTNIEFQYEFYDFTGTLIGTATTKKQTRADFIYGAGHAAGVRAINRGLIDDEIVPAQADSAKLVFTVSSLNTGGTLGFDVISVNRMS